VSTGSRGLFFLLPKGPRTANRRVEREKRERIRRGGTEVGFVVLSSIFLSKRGWHPGVLSAQKKEKGKERRGRRAAVLDFHLISSLSLQWKTSSAIGLTFAAGSVGRKERGGEGGEERNLRFVFMSYI